MLRREDRPLIVALFAIAIAILVAWGVPRPHGQIENDAANSAEHHVAPISADSRIADYTELLAWFTGLLALVSAVQGAFLYRADKTARLTAEAATKSAAAAQKAADVSERQLFSTQRAWMTIADIEIGAEVADATSKTGIFPISAFNLRIIWKNTGNTPAMNCMLWATIEVEHVPRDPKIDNFVFVGPVQSQAAVGSGSILNSILAHTAENALAAFDGTKAPYLHCLCQYNDVFEGTPIHTTELRALISTLKKPTIRSGEKADHLQINIKSLEGSRMT